MVIEAPSAYEAFTEIHVDVDTVDAICTVSLNRPNVRNAFSRIMTYEVHQQQLTSSYRCRTALS
eukprot:COSAG05_NODE_175_length_14930_cov_7.138679_11_plen_64_part_00